VLNDLQDISFKINREHPCLDGHFPGNPIVPAVVMLDEITRLIKEQNTELHFIGFGNVKFLKPVLAEQAISIILELPVIGNKIKFKLQRNGSLVAQGDIKVSHQSVS